MTWPDMLYWGLIIIILLLAGLIIIEDINKNDDP